MRRILIWSFRILLVLLMVMAALVAAVHIPAVQRRLIAHGLGMLNRSGLVFIESSAVSLNLFRREAHVRDLTIRARAGDLPFVSLDRATIRWRYQDLRRGLSALDTVDAEGLTIDIARLPDGRLNLPESSGESKRTLEGVPKRATVRRVSFLYSDAPLTLCLRDLQIDLAGGRWTLAATTPGSLAYGAYSGVIARLGFEGQATHPSTDGLIARGTLAVDGIRVPEVGSISATATIEYRGSEERLGIPAFRIVSPLAEAIGKADVSLAAGPSSASVSAAGQGLRADGTATWTGLDAEKATAAARVVANRRDVTGSANLALTADQLRVDAENLRAFGARAGGRVTLDRATLRLGGRLTGDYPVLDGTVRFAAGLSGSASSPRALVKAESNNLSLGKIQGIELDATAQVTPERAVIQTGTVSWQGQQIQVSGDVSLRGTPALHVDADAPMLDPKPFLKAYGVEGEAAGTLALSTTLRGPAADPDVSARLTGTGLALLGETLGELSATLGYRNSFVSLGEFRLEKQPGAELQASGWADLDEETFLFNARSTPLPIESLKLGDRPLRGEVELNAKLQGSFDRPEGLAEVRAKGDEIGEAYANASFSRGVVAFGVAADQVATNLAGVNGSADLRIYGNVPVSDWEKVDGVIEVPRVEVEVEKNRIRNRGPIELAFSNGLLAIRRFAVESDGAVVEAKGSLPLQQEKSGQSIQVSGEIPLELANRYLPPDAEVEIGGKANLSGTVVGTLRDPRPEGRLEVADGSVSSPQLNGPVTGVELKARATRDEAILESLRVPVGPGSVSGNARLPLKGGGAGQFRLLFDKADPLAILKLPGRKRTGVITGELTGSASAAKLEELSASARFTELSVSSARGTIQQKGETKLSIAQGVLSIDSFEIEGRDTSLVARGTVGLLGDRPLNVRVDGKVETEILTPESTNLAVAGLAEAHVIVAGTLAKPHITGGAEMQNGQFFIDSPPLAADQVAFKARFEGQKVTIDSLRATLNGGRVTGEGTLTVADGGLRDVNVRLNGRGLFLEYPRGFQTASDISLRLESQGRFLVLGGEIGILDGAYREPIDLALLLRARNRVTLSDEPNPVLENLRFNVAVRTRQPILVDNNLGRLSADADLRLVGSIQDPGLTGRIELGDDGQIYFSGRTFRITTGVIDFTDESEILPRFNLAAETRVSNYDVTMRLTGEMGDLKTTFSSEPSANEDQVMALLFTGSIENANRGAAYAQTQLLTLFGSSLTGGIANRLRNTFGVSEFRIDPGIVSPDSDPTARLTIGQNLTPELKFTYSTSLSDAQDQIWIAEYDWRRRFLARYFRQNDQSNRVEFRQKIRFGGGDKTGDFTTRERRNEYVIGSVDIAGNFVFDEAVIRKKLGLKPGKKYDFLKAQKRIESLRAFYAKNGYAEARVQQQRRRAEGRVDLALEIDAGPKVNFIFEGADPSRSVKARLARIWQQGLIERQRMGATQSELRRDYIRKGYADAVVVANVRSTDAGKTVVYEISRGRDYGRPRIELVGAPKDYQSELKAALRSQKLDYDAKADPAAVSRFAARFLRVKGYLAAQAEDAKVDSPDNKHTTVTVRIDAGPEFKLGQVRYAGNQALNSADLNRSIVLAPGDPYTPEDRYVIARRVQQAYWNRGYRQAEVDATEELDVASGRANLLIQVEEKQQLRVASIKVDGLAKASEKYVRKLITIDEGDVLSALEVNNSRRNLLDSGAFNLIDFTYPPIDQVADPAMPQSVALNVTVREPKPYRFDYGATYDTVRGPGVILDFSTINVLGEARTLGFRTTLDRDRQEYRTYFSQPFLGSKRINTTATAFFRNEKLTIFDTRTFGLTAQQFVRLGPKFNFTYGYKYEYSEVSLRDFDLTFTGRSAPLISALVRDTRDNVLDATKGSFLSSAFEYGPSWLGGDITYFRYYQQAFKYFGLTKPVLMPFESEARRSRTVYATALRVGVANTTEGSEFLPVDRFFAGGGTTIRGYDQNSVGPNLNGDGLGGRATFVLNNELRFPLYRFLDGVAFIDAGNVWELPSQFSLTDLRGGAGFGVRIRNPFVVLRFDYGFKIGRRPGESIGGFFFSIGQAF